MLLVFVSTTQPARSLAPSVGVLVSSLREQYTLANKCRRAAHAPLGRTQQAFSILAGVRKVNTCQVDQLSKSEAPFEFGCRPRGPAVQPVMRVAVRGHLRHGGA